MRGPVEGRLITMAADGGKVGGIQVEGGGWVWGGDGADRSDRKYKRGQNGQDIQIDQMYCERQTAW